MNQRKVGRGDSDLIGNTVYQFRKGRRGRRRAAAIKAAKIKDHSGRVPSTNPELLRYQWEKAELFLDI